MKDQFVFAIPGMLPRVAINRPQQVAVIEDGSAEVTVGYGDTDATLPDLEFLAIDLSGCILYHTVGSRDVLVSPIAGSPGRCRIYQKFPAGTFGITPCRIIMRSSAGEQQWFAGARGMARTLAGRSEDERSD